MEKSSRSESKLTPEELALLEVSGLLETEYIELQRKIALGSAPSNNPAVQQSWYDNSCYEELQEQTKNRKPDLFDRLFHGLRSKKS